MTEETLLPTQVCDTTCRTPGCVNENVTHRVPVPVNVDGVFRVVCGTCSAPVTEIVPITE